MQRRFPAVTGPRYEVRNRNGTFHVFDTIWYGAVDSRPNANAAQRRADDLNARPRKAVRK